MEKNIIPNIVFVYWGQGFNEAPPLVTSCIRSLEQQNPKANIVKLDDSSVSRYVDIPEYILQKKETGIISFAQFSDILRINLLYRYGGIWSDATCLHTQALEPYISAYAKNGFFAFKDRNTIASWFMASSPQNSLVAAVRQPLHLYWNDFSYLENYFILHMMFRALSQVDSGLKQELSRMPVVCRDIPHVLQRRMYNAVSDDKMQQIISDSFIHKLTYKYKRELITPDCLLAKLFPDVFAE